MDNKGLTMEDVKEAIHESVVTHTAPIKRESDSLDDFEHLGHDNSPLIDATRVTDDLSAFDPLKMDSNLLEMGDVIPKQSHDDAKLDKYLQDMSEFTAPKHQESPEVPNKDITQEFVEAERGSPLKKLIEDHQLERYSDSDDDFKPSKYEEFPKKHELPESFKDVEPEPLPKKDYPIEPLKPEKVEVVKEKTPEPDICVKPVKCEVKPKKAENVTDAEAIFCKMGLDTWFNPEKLNPKVESLIYWRDPKKSGPVFAGVLLILLSLTYYSFISVIAYLSLLILTGTISFRIYKNIIQAVQKTGDGHPFKDFLEFDVQLSQEKIKEITEIGVAHINAAVVELRRLFLVEDLVDSIKFGVLLWTFTYLGSWFNGMTLIIIAWVALFTLPKVYEANKTQIDANLEIVRTKLAEITSKVKAAIPYGKKAEEKKEQ